MHCKKAFDEFWSYPVALHQVKKYMLLKESNHDCILMASSLEKVSHICVQPRKTAALSSQSAGK